VKLVHAADLHIDSPLCGLESYPAAPVEQIRGATRRALKNLVELCVDESAKLLVIAGDLFDGDWRDYSTGLFFIEQMVRLREAGVSVAWLRGNHDAGSKVTKHLKLPDNVRELSARRPMTIRYEELGVAVHGQGFEVRDVDRDLAAAYPDATAGLLNVGLLHTALDGRPGHDRYAPTNLATLIDKGYDYWALGHVHRREVLHRDPWIVFPGNLQGRHIRETGPKGATLISANNGCIDAVEPRALDVVRWYACDIDVAGARSTDAVLERVREALEDEARRAEGRLLAVRVRLSGQTRAHARLQQDPERWLAEVRGVGCDVGSGEVWIEKVSFDTRMPIDVEALSGKDDPLGQLCRSLSEIRADEQALSQLGDELSELRTRLADLRRDGIEFDFDTPAGLRQLLDDVQGMLVPRLLREEDES
jgi:DNA repair exonuclease SbcCD nuclease subunit